MTSYIFTFVAGAVVGIAAFVAFVVARANIE